MSEATLPLQAAAPPRFSEDVVAVGLGLVVFLLAFGSLVGADALGLLVTTSVWTNPSSALAPVSKAYASLGGAGSLLMDVPRPHGCSIRRRLSARRRRQAVRRSRSLACL